MSNITAAEVNKLRKMTGAGMMDCKKALIEANGDFDAATDILRAKGQKLANKRADRESNEGYVVAKVNANSTFGIISMLNCETDFVAKNDNFVKFAEQIADTLLASGVKTLDEAKAVDMGGRSIQDHITEQIGVIGEKLDLGQYEIIEAPSVYAYNHHGNRLATIMGLNKADVENIETAGKEVNMQIAAMAPVAVDKAGVPSDVIEHEIEIGKEQARQEGKPEELIEKIALGKLNKFYKENTLLNQEFVREGKISVKDYLGRYDKELTVTSFCRVTLS